MFMQSNSVQELKVKYPEIAQEFERIVGEQYSLFAAKMLDYGKGNISVGTNLETPEEVKLSLTGLWFRMNDKMNRMKNLVLLNNKPKVETESTVDTFQDLSIYGIIAQIVQNGKWK
jgi:hypothetical protein